MIYRSIGIYRKIPLNNEVTRLDGTSSKNRAKIRNVSVSEKYTITKENRYETIKIGDSSQTITGRHSYTIKYTYDIGKDPLKNADELYFNLIGDEWDTSIKNVTFKITMPKEFDKSLLGFSSGAKGSTDGSNVIYNVNGNVISGSLNGELNKKEALTVRLTLPEGYFVVNMFRIDIYSILVMVVSVVFVLMSYLLWAKRGENDEVIETVEFYPPEGYNSAEIGFLYNGEANKQSIISLLIYLANKGYLRIDEIEQKRFLGKSKSFKLVKLKNYDGNNENEKIFFDGLFKEKNCVVEMDLYNKFYKTLNKIRINLNDKKNKNKIFDSKTTGKKKWIVMMMIAIFSLITIKPIIEYSGIEVLAFGLIFPGIGLCFLYGILFEKSHISLKVFESMFLLGFGIFPWAAIVFPALIDNFIYLFIHIVGLICILILMSFMKKLPKRSQFGNEMLGKIRGFKRFLENAEKLQLENLVEQDPEYFYDILPYTYALGVSSVWIKQFETIAIEPPDWYSSPSGFFDRNDFNNFMNTTMNYASAVMSSVPSEGSGSSGFSGGGSSGGGSGGGGGGSW